MAAGQKKCLPIDVTKLRVGQQYKNYPAICEALGEEIKDGKNRKEAQQRNWERFFDWKREGQKYIVTEIYDHPREEIEFSPRISKYNQFIHNILLLFLYQMYKGEGKHAKQYKDPEQNQGNSEKSLQNYHHNDNFEGVDASDGLKSLDISSHDPDNASFYTMEISKSNLYLLIGIINNNFYEGLNNPASIPEDINLSVGESGRNLLIKEFYSHTHHWAWDTTKRALESLRRNKDINYNFSIMAKQGEEWLPLDPEEINQILEIEGMTLRSYGCKNEWEAYIKGVMKKYKNDVAVAVKRQLNIDYYYHTIKIDIIKKVVESDAHALLQGANLSADEVERLNQLEMNQSVVSSMIASAERQETALLAGENKTASYVLDQINKDQSVKGFLSPEDKNESFAREWKDNTIKLIRSYIQIVDENVKV